MLKLNFNLRHQDIRLVNKGAVVASDSKNYLVAKFHTVSDDWETPLTAIFTDDKHKQPYAVIVGANEELADDECFVPWEVLTDECNVYVSVYCGNLHTTVTAAFKVRKSGYADGETPPPPSPTVYDIILQTINGLSTNKQDKLTAGENITITEENVISASSGSNDYTGLTNKPSINNVTLSGNKSSDDLSLQDKLTAGENITIENNVISAEGGVTDYDELENKPKILIRGNSAIVPAWEITNKIHFDSWQFFGDRATNGTIRVSLDNLVSRYHFEPLSYDFNKFSSAPYNGCLELQHIYVSNFPNALNRIDTSKPYFLTQHFDTTEYGDLQRHAFRKVSGYSRDGDFIEYAQICYINYMYWLDNEIISQTDWVELTGGGSQIVSGVVNANGTITFTDSEGNTFTTSGESVIGADGFSPTATVTQTASGATVSITDSTGTTTANISNGADGQDYVLTVQDKSDIADIVLSELPTTQGVLYGNTSN